jgi:hypothetical protein
MQTHLFLNIPPNLELIPSVCANELLVISKFLQIYSMFNPNGDFP